MIKEATIRKLVDYVLINACSVNSTGLYNGKAGLALSLFEVARYLQDEYIEEQAFDLLQESLLTKNKNINFENGLSGVGYVLLYLIENKFVDADFEELFGEKIEKILVDIDKLKEKPVALLSFIRMTYFLASVKSFRPVDKRIDEIMKSLFEANELYFAIQFFDFKDINCINNKSEVLGRFEIYLQMVYECRHADYSRIVLEDYAELYRSGRIMSSYKTAYYLEKIDSEGKHEDIIESNRQYSYFKNPNNLTLKNRIDLVKLCGETNSLQEIISAKKRGGVEKAILKLIPQGAFVAGYEQGISRLLIYLTSNTTKLL